MTSASGTKSRERLSSLLTAGTMSAEDTSRAQVLLERLQSPTCITAIGHKDSGKTTVLNSLLGDRKMPDIGQATIVELAYGEHAQYNFRADGAWSSECTGHLSDGSLPENCTHVLQELPLDQIKTRRFAEITLPSDVTGRDEVMQWVSQNSDIVLWCTKDFGAEEAALWSQAPEALKDHSFLILTFADECLAAGTLETKTQHFQEQSAEEFMCLYPIAAKHALSSCKSGEIADDALWKASGGFALMQGLSRDIQAGRQADVDYADLFLSRFPVLPEAAETPTADDQDRPSVSKQPANQISPMKRNEAIATALTVLQAPVDEMLRSVENERPSPSRVLDHTAQAAQALATLLMDASPEDPDLNAFRENVLEYEQMALLLQHEGTETAAHDAVTALLQLKKEMSEVAYA